MFEIAGRPVGGGAPCLVMGEVAQSHDGSLGLAHAFVEAIAAAGADAVKFQTHIASAESTPAEAFRVPLRGQDATRYDYWKRMEFAEEEWQGLARHAHERGLLFLSSPFSVQAVDLLARLPVPAYKVPSGEITNGFLLDRIADEGKPVLLSTGMSPLSQVDAAVARLRPRSVPLLVMQCTSAYPCPPEKLGLNLIATLRERYACPVGLSDHTGTIFSGLAAAVLGISALEVHVTLSREMYGPDVPASVTTGELRTLVEGIRFIERALAHPVDKDALAAELAPLRALFFKSVVAGQELPAGTVLERSHLLLKKPGHGIPAERLDSLVGRRLRRPVAKDQLLCEQDLEA